MAQVADIGGLGREGALPAEGGRSGCLWDVEARDGLIRF